MPKAISKASDSKKNYSIYLDTLAHGAPKRRLHSDSKAHHQMRDNAILALGVADAQAGRVRSRDEFVTELTRIFGPTRELMTPERRRRAQERQQKRMSGR